SFLEPTRDSQSITTLISPPLSTHVQWAMVVIEIFPHNFPAPVVDCQKHGAIIVVWLWYSPVSSGTLWPSQRASFIFRCWQVAWHLWPKRLSWLGHSN